LKMSFPITSGYTINIVRTPKQQVVKYLVETETDTNNPQSFLLKCNSAVAPVEEVIEERIHEEVFENEQVNGDEIFIADIGQEELIYDTTEVVAEEVVNSEPLVQETNSEMRVLVSEKDKTVFCDICQMELSCAKDGVDHMQTKHGVLTFQGPLFQCDFCLLLVTDRVSHMKKTHYLPLERGFSREDSLYNCLSCSYASDQLTNIRNHVDAKHTAGGRKYLCTQCSTAYKTLNSLRAHKSRVHGKKRKRELENKI